MIVDDAMRLEDIVDIVRACGGAQSAGQSDEAYAAYHEALEVVERELRAAWRRHWMTILVENDADLLDAE